MITNCGLYNDWAGANKADCLIPGSFCFFNERIIFGGPISAGSLTDGAFWTELLTAHIQYFPGYTTVSSDFNTGEWVIVGAPAGGDNETPFTVEMSIMSGYKATTIGRAAIDAVKKGAIQLVYAQVGTVYDVREIGNRIAVYGSAGVSLIAQGEDGVFRATIITDNPVSYYRTVAGDKEKHIWMDREGSLWYMLNEYIPRRLGYKEYLSGLTRTATTIQYDPTEDDYYISDGTNSYILTTSGLCKARYLLSSIVRDPSTGAFYGTFKTGATATFEVVTQSMDMFRQSIKMVQTVEVVHAGLSSVLVGVDYRYTKSDNYTRSTMKGVNKEEIAWPMVAATDPRIVLTGTPGTGALNRVQVRWKAGDVRNIRGLTEQGEENV